MIIKEFYSVRKDGIKLFRTYSDNNKIIVRNDGIEFEEAIDIENSNYIYTESKKDITNSWHESTDEATEKDYLEALAELGVNTDEEN